MGKLKDFVETFSLFSKAAPAIAAYKPPKDHDRESMGLMLEKTAAKYPDELALIFEGDELTWSEFNALVNRYAHTLKSLEVRAGDSVSVFMENRIAMLAATLAVTKIGAVAALINTSLQGKQLVHCLVATHSRKCLVGEELTESVEEIRTELPYSNQDYLWIPDEGNKLDTSSCPSWATNLLPLLAHVSDSNPLDTLQVKAGEKALYIFTSGTTGLPKAAIIYHRRFLAAATIFGKIGLRTSPGDRIYLCLPLYHATGLFAGFGSALYGGAAVYIRRRFSASRFWQEVHEHKINIFVYIGELCRFLSQQPARPEEKDNPVTTMIGNGLRPDVWDQFRSRFNIARIFEFYGSSEGNATFLNVLNKDRTIGASSASLMLAKYDIVADELVYDASGKLIEVKKGEPGLLLAEISEKYNFDGYLNSEATNKKILFDVKKKGDRWFNTGDMIRQIDVGFAFGLPHFQFVDRVGDTFRWRGENVSTNEVAEILSQHAQVETANVYGVEVPGAEGKAGMVSLTLNTQKEFDMDAFASLVRSELPTFARPVFVRIQPIADTTGTFKLQKGRLREEGYDLAKVEDPLFIAKPGSEGYTRLDKETYETLRSAQLGF